MIYLDTHIALRLFEGISTQMGPRAKRLIHSDPDVRISPIVLFEIEMLHEIGRIRPTASAVRQALSDRLDVTVCDLPFARVIETSLAEAWTRDPFDRLIVAQAKSNNAILITADDRIHAHYSRALR